MTEKKDEITIFKSRTPTWAMFLIRLGLPSVVREVRIYPKEILIKALYDDYQYEWKDILEAFTIVQTGYAKGMGISERYLILRTNDNKKFRLGTSEFENGKVLIDEVLPKYLKVSHHAYKEMTWLYYSALLVWIGLLFAFIKTGNRIYALCDAVFIFLYLFYVTKRNGM